jgi:hypothetical protein
VSKICSKCKTKKELEDYNNNKASKDGKASHCRECGREASANFRANNREYVKKYKKKYGKANRKKLNIANKKYYDKNKDILKANKKKYYLENRESISKRVKEYQGENRDKIRVTSRVLSFKKYRSNSKFKIKKLLSGRVRSAVKGKAKSSKTMDLIGCDINHLMNHLQKTADQNYPELDFDVNNYSGKEWHIDHIKPCASFDMLSAEQQQECFNWKNLQILTAKDNIIKGCN